MADVLVFLKKDYSEKEIQDITENIASQIHRVGGNEVLLLKTTESTILYEYDEDYKVPEEIVVAHLSSEMLPVYYKYIGYIGKVLSEDNLDEYFAFCESEEHDRMLNEINSIHHKYCKKCGGYKTKQFAPNKYVVLARIDFSARFDFRALLQSLNLETTAIVYWDDDEFDEDDKPFEKLYGYRSTIQTMLNADTDCYDKPIRIDISDKNYQLQFYKPNK